MVARRVLFRLHTAIVAVLFCVSALALPSQAVSPQEGWFVRARETITANGRTQDYFIIDNKMTSDPWYVEMRSNLYYHPSNIFNPGVVGNNSSSLEYRGIGFLNEFYRGYSNVDWLVDDDWLIGVNVSGVTSSLSSLVTDMGMRLYVFDASRAPLLFMDSSDSSWGVVGNSGNLLAGLTMTSSKQVMFGYGWQIVDGYTGYLSLDPDNSASPAALFDLFNAYGGGTGNWSYNNINGTSINDLCVAVLPNFRADNIAFGGAGNVYARIAIHWAIPVSKAPADTQIGDAWPKVQPIDVQFQDKYESWKDAALANSPVTDADNVDDMINGYNDQLASSTELGTDAAEAWDGITPMLAVVEPFSPFLLLASGLFILAFFIKKGMG